MNGLVENKVIEIGGTYVITISATFRNCIFRMSGDSRIIVLPMGTSLVKVTFDNCNFYECDDMWRGIEVNTASLSGNFLFMMKGCSVEGAHIGLTLDEGNGSTGLSYIVTDNTFRNNYIGMSNLRQTGGSLNAVVKKNLFYQTAHLSDRVGSLVHVAMPEHPISHAGIRYVSISSTVGVLVSGEENNFKCLRNGIVALGTRNNITSVNNHFEWIFNRGVWGHQGSILVRGCTFAVGRGVCIFGESTRLTVKGNTIEGNWVGGVQSIANNNAQFITVNDRNHFEMDGDRWAFGVSVERPQALSGKHCTIDNNEFNIGEETTAGTCITLFDHVSATDVASISHNRINIVSDQEDAANFGIFAYLGGSDNLVVEFDTITYSGTTSVTGWGWGIALRDADLFVFPNVESNGHKVRSNIITGPDRAIVGPVACAIHSDGVQGVDYCENWMDETYYGLHFRYDCGNVSVSRNFINRHSDGLQIDGGNFMGAQPDIGPQIGKGNEWSDATGAYLNKAVNFMLPNNDYVIPSIFRVPESNNWPFLPPNALISPDPSISGDNQNWFVDDDVPTKYCDPESQDSIPRRMTAQEMLMVEDSTVFADSALWDLRYRTYTKLLISPELRPGSSPEEAFFNSLSNTMMDSLGQVLQLVESSLAFSPSDQTEFDSVSTAGLQLVTNLVAWDETQDYSSTTNLDLTWFATRAPFLDSISENATYWAAIAAQRDTTVWAGLEDALALNNGLNTVHPSEIASQSLYDIWLRHLLAQSMTETRYEQILELAQLDLGPYSGPVRAARVFVAHCDAYLVPDEACATETEERVSALQTAELPQANNFFTLAPNPGNGSFEVAVQHLSAASFVIMNVHGQRVKVVEIPSGDYRFRIELSQAIPGLYWGTLLDAQGRVLGTKTIVVHH